MSETKGVRSQALTWLRRGGLVILLVLVVEYLVLPRPPSRRWPR